jgi:hypothetical protein
VALTTIRVKNPKSAVDVLPHVPGKTHRVTLSIIQLTTKGGSQMKEYIKAIRERIIALDKAIKTAEQDRTDFPAGRLRVSETGNHVRYYHVEPSGDESGTYITRKNRNLAETLAQKDYNMRFLSRAHAELESLETCIHLIPESDSDEIYQTLDPRRRRLVTPYLIPDDLYAAEWRSQPYKTNPHMSESKLYDTNNGEKVRSKTEAILADMLLELGIPYRYEQALKLRGGTVRYPDFTLLRITTREEIYLEHFGLLDGQGYRDKCLHKLNEYRNSGIYPGKNLLITYESEGCPFDIKGTRKMLKDLLCGSEGLYDKMYSRQN